ncbi:MAG: type II toxin-antitoxin system VapC family toxin [Burkholderiales bacterium]|nr:type II toxin-antitoxin system VapC family toxin [Pseudomonadota bacterium]
MTSIVVDASVIVKWLFPHGGNDANTDKALRLFTEIEAERHAVRQPPHWLAEAAAVAVRIDPSTAREKIAAFFDLQFATLASVEVYSAACALSSELGHHLFDTLYHAVALADDCVLVTADERYYQKAKRFGAIVLLADFDTSQ